MVRFLTGMAACLVCFSLLLCGCGGSNGGTIEVTGTVTFDGTPVESGTISFLPKDGKGASAAGKIVSGQYTAAVPPGEKKVSIIGERVVGQDKRDPSDPNSETFDVTESFIPPQYNAKTTLTATISEDGGAVDFELTSK